MISDYATGLERLGELQRRLLMTWEGRLLQARLSVETLPVFETPASRATSKTPSLEASPADEIHQRAVRHWQALEAEKEARYRRQLETWQKSETAIRKKHARQMAVWRQRKLQPRWFEAFIYWAAFGGALLLALIFSIPTLYLFQSIQEGWALLAATGLSWIGAIGLGLLAIWQELRIFRQRRQAPVRLPGAPRPEREPAAPHPDELASLHQLPPTTLLPRWLEMLDARTVSLLHEQSLTPAWLFFDQSLSGEYLALHNLNLGDGYRLDIVLVGPNGVWLFLDIDWPGIIVCNGQTWHPMGNDQPDDPRTAKQLTWISCQERLLARLQDTLTNLPNPWEEIVSGGLVFSNPQVQLQPSDECAVSADTPSVWLERIRATPVITSLNLPERLHIIDTLAKYSRQKGETSAIVHPLTLMSAVSLAESVFSQANKDISRYLESLS
jgi:hypothetical protein